MSALQISLETPSDDRVVILLGGELDLATAPELEESLRSVESNDTLGLVVLDLRKLRFIDSSGLRVVIGADSRARKSGRRLVLVQGGDSVHRVFRLTLLDQRLEFVDDPREIRES